jgi:thioredoxin 1
MKLHTKVVSAIAIGLSLLFVACGSARQPVTGTGPAPAVAAADSGKAPAARTEPPETRVEPAGRPEPAAAETGPAAVPPGSTNLPKLWDFFATWCGPCRTQAPIIAEMEAEYHSRIEIASIDVDQSPELARRFNIQVVPTLVFLDASGRELDRQTGLMQKDEILAKFRSLGFIQ